MTNNSGTDRLQALKELSDLLTKGELPTSFPTLEEFGITEKLLKSIATRFERYQAMYGVVAVIAFFCSLIALVVFSSSSEKTGLLGLTVCVSILASLALGTLSAYLAFNDDRYWLHHPDENACFEIQETLSSLRLHYDAIKRAEQERHEAERLLQEARKRQIEELYLEEEARQARIRSAQIEYIEEQVKQTEDRKRRVSERPPIPIYSSREFSMLMAGIDEDVKHAFFKLTSNELEEFFNHYRQQFGAAAANHARKTFPKWKSGEVKMRGTSAEKVLILAPSFLQFSDLFEIVRKLRRFHTQRIHRSVRCTLSDWRQEVLPVVDEVVRAGNLFKLPNAIIDRVKWLVDDDGYAAQKLLSAVDLDEARIRLQDLEIVFDQIESLSKTSRATLTCSRNIELPQGTIAVTIEMPKPGILAWVIDKAS